MSGNLTPAERIATFDAAMAARRRGLRLLGEQAVSRRASVKRARRERVLRVQDDPHAPPPTVHHSAAPPYDQYAHALARAAALQRGPVGVTLAPTQPPAAAERERRQRVALPESYCDRNAPRHERLPSGNWWRVGRVSGALRRRRCSACGRDWFLRHGEQSRFARCAHCLHVVEAPA